MVCVSIRHQSHTSTTDTPFWKSSAGYFTCSWTFSVSICHRSHTAPDSLLWKSSSGDFAGSWTLCVAIRHQNHTSTTDTSLWKSSSGYFTTSWAFSVSIHHQSHTTPTDTLPSSEKIVLVIIHIHECFVYPYAIRTTRVPHILFFSFFGFPLILF